MLLKHKRHHAGSPYGARKPADIAVTLWSMYIQAAIRRGRYRDKGLYRENSIAIESEARYSLNV